MFDIKKSHNLPSNNNKCSLTDHQPVWDGNYYTCANCGKEFVIADQQQTALIDSIKTWAEEKDKSIGYDTMSGKIRDEHAPGYKQALEDLTQYLDKLKK